MNNFDIQDIRKTNLKLVIDEYAQGDVKTFSEETGINISYVYSMLKSMSSNNPRTITSRSARLIEKFYKLPPLTLDDPNYKKNLKCLESDTLDEKVSILECDFLSKNNYNKIVTQESPKFTSKILEKLSQVTDQIVHYYEVHNDLMAPTFENNDLAFIVNIEKIHYDEFKNGAIYLVKYSKQPYLIRLYLEFNEQLRLKVDNPFRQQIFHEMTISWKEFQQSIQVIGKVIGKLSLKKDFI